MGEQIIPDTICAHCSQLHSLRWHAGRKQTCLMASCNCTGFVAKIEEPVEVEDPQVVMATVSLTSHKRCYLERVADGSYQWFKNGQRVD